MTAVLLLDSGQLQETGLDTRVLLLLKLEARVLSSTCSSSGGVNIL
jgi:hypothetical protein